LFENNRRHVFISHASEDKQEIASPLAEALSNSGISVWYDEYEIIWGDSIFEKINEGLSNSIIGIVIFSPHFLNKNWPTTEFRTIATLMIKQKIRMLPLLHNISLDEITTKYPLLEDIHFQSSNTDISSLVEQVKKNISKLENLRLSVENKSYINSQLNLQFPNMNDDEASHMEMNILHPVSEEIKQASVENYHSLLKKKPSGIMKKLGIFLII
jgi:TIR domain